MTIAVTFVRTNFLNTAAVAALALPFWAGASVAQEAQTQTQGTEQAQETQQTGQAQPSDDAGQAAAGEQDQGATDALIATIGEAEIRNSDVMQAIGALPPPLNAQPPEMLVPLALEQLFLREAVVQEARAQGLAEDPEVQSLVEGATRAAEEDALVQVWLQRELAGRVTPEAVEQAYAGLQAVAGDQPVPALEQIRPQIEQSLAQQAVNDIRASLLADAEITLYGPDGQPVDQQAGAGGQTGDAGQAGTAAEDGQAEDASGGGQDASQDPAAGEEAPGGEQATGGD